MEKQDTPRQPEPNKKNQFNRCLLEVRGLGLEQFRLGSDGRKGNQAARSRYKFLNTLAGYANPDGTFVRNGINYSPQAQTLQRREHIASATLYRLTDDLRALGLLSWTREENHYGRRIYTIHFPTEKHLSYSSGEPRIREVITPLTMGGVLGKTPLTVGGDNTSHIRGQSQQNDTVAPTVQYSPPSFDDLPSSKNSKTGGVRGGLSLDHHHRLNTDLPKESDDDAREKIPPPSSPTNRLERLKAIAFANFQAKHSGEYSEVDVISALETIEARRHKSGKGVSSHRYYEMGLENELLWFNKSDALVSQDPELREANSCEEDNRVCRNPNCPVHGHAALRLSKKTEMRMSRQVTRKEFDKFWRKYPRRVSDKLWVRELWVELDCTAVASRILNGLEQWLKSPLWQRDKRRIPNASTFLAKEIWKELPPDLASEMKP